MFQMQVFTSEGWQSVKPSGKNESPYECETREEAERMLNMSYPDQCIVARLEGDRRYKGENTAGVRVVEMPWGIDGEA